MCAGPFLVEVKQDHIEVRVTGTSYVASYYRRRTEQVLSPASCP